MANDINSLHTFNEQQFRRFQIACERERLRGPRPLTHSEERAVEHATICERTVHAVIPRDVMRAWGAENN